MRFTWLGLPLLAIAMAGAAHAQMPTAIAAPGESAVATWHAEGAQVYECKAGADGKLAWAFREPIATLLLDARRSAATTPAELGAHGRQRGGRQGCRQRAGSRREGYSLLKLEVVSSRGSGALSGVTTVQRINTVGGRHDGACEKVGAFFSAPYAADYVFLKK